MDEANRDTIPIVTGPTPGVISSYGHGWRQLWKYFLELLLIIIIGFIIGIPSGISGWAGEALVATGILGFFGVAYSILVAGPVQYGISFSYLKAARGDRLEIKDMFAAFQNYWNAVLANLLVGAIIFLGIILLIVPGIVFACKLAFTPYLVVDRKMEVIDAVKESWRLTNGRAWKVFLIYLLGIPIGIAGFICFGVGIILATMWITLAMASFYYAVTRTNEPSTMA